MNHYPSPLRRRTARTGEEIQKDRRKIRFLNKGPEYDHMDLWGEITKENKHLACCLVGFI
jgi:hypothetical protein